MTTLSPVHVTPRAVRNRSLRIRIADDGLSGAPFVGVLTLGSMTGRRSYRNPCGFANSAVENPPSMQSASFGSAFTFFAYSHALSSVPEGETLQVFELPHGYVLNVPISSLALTIPKKDLKNNIGTGSKLNPRYFLFQNERRPDISVSGWIEPSKKFTSTKKILEGDKIQWSINGLPSPTDVEFKKIGGWDAVLYDMNMPEACTPISGLTGSRRAHG